MKIFTFIFFGLLAGSINLACTHSPIPVVPVTPPAPAPTTVCGFTSVTMPSLLPSISGIYTGTLSAVGSATFEEGVYVIRNMTDWKSFYGPTTAPAAPIDFTSEMLIVFISPSCSQGYLAFQSVCVSPSQVVISFSNTAKCAVCNHTGINSVPTAVAVPQSNAPISWSVIDIASPCHW